MNGRIWLFHLSTQFFFFLKIFDRNTISITLKMPYCCYPLVISLIRVYFKHFIKSVRLFGQYRDAICTHIGIKNHHRYENLKSLILQYVVRRVRLYSKSNHLVVGFSSINWQSLTSLSCGEFLCWACLRFN